MVDKNGRNFKERKKHYVHLYCDTDGAVFDPKDYRFKSRKEVYRDFESGPNSIHITHVCKIYPEYQEKLF